MKGFTFVLILLLVLCSMLIFVSRISVVKAGGYIYIRADGSVDPLTAPISTMDNITYTFTYNITSPIVVQRSNIVVDGAGYTLQGIAYWGNGVSLSNASYVTVKNINIKGFDFGVRFLYTSSYNTISGNNVTNSYYDGIHIGENSKNNSIFGNIITYNRKGVALYNSHNNTVSGNTMTNSGGGIYLGYKSSNNIISQNNIKRNMYAIWFYGASNNSIFHNNFVNNTQQVYDESSDSPSVPPSIDIWDDGYPSGGNYWGDYKGTDSDYDGIINTPYIIDVNNQDRYPLMSIFSDFKATSEHHVQTICNSTISDFQFNGTAISFNVSGQNGTSGFCRICIPTALMDNTYHVFINDTEVSYDLLPFSNTTYSYLYFNYTLSTSEVVIVSEFHASLENPFWIEWWFWTLIATGIAILAGVVYFLKKRKLSNANYDLTILRKN